MAYHTSNELQNFIFGEAAILELKNEGERFTAYCADVIIPTSNSCNAEVEKMGTDELKIQFVNVTKVVVKKDGYRIYNLDDTLREEIPDEIIEESGYKALFEELKEQRIYTIEKVNDAYQICIDTEDETISYTVLIWADSDVEDWEFHHRLPANLR